MSTRIVLMNQQEEEIKAPLSPKRLQFINDELKTRFVASKTFVSPAEQRPVDATKGVNRVVFDHPHRMPQWKDDVASTILWSISSVISTILTKSMFDSFPYPIFISCIMLSFQTLSATLSWFVWQSTKPPSFSRLKRKHAIRLFGASIAHGLGTLLNYYTLWLGPASASVMLRMWQWNLWRLSSLSIASGILILSDTTALQMICGLLAHASFSWRSKIRISTIRFNGSQNVFSLTCGVALCFVCLPLSLLIEGGAPWKHLTFQQTAFLGILGMAYITSSRMTFLLASKRRLDLMRRVATYIVSMWWPHQTPANAVLASLVGATLVFLGWWYRKPTPLSRDRLCSSDSWSNREQAHSSDALFVRKFSGPRDRAFSSDDPRTTLGRRRPLSSS